VVHEPAGTVGMAVPTIKKSRKAKIMHSPRASVTFPPELYQHLETLAKKKKVSVAWIVREAAEKYIADQWPLFAGVKHG
jgi:metal-responsive CopG/Arc/MetJ family transcriptional regulator